MLVVSKKIYSNPFSFQIFSEWARMLFKFPFLLDFELDTTIKSASVFEGFSGR